MDIPAAKPIDGSVNRPIKYGTETPRIGKYVVISPKTFMTNQTTVDITM
jgi:hypothetical protein